MDYSITYYGVPATGSAGEWIAPIVTTNPPLEFAPDPNASLIEELRRFREAVDRLTAAIRESA